MGRSKPRASGDDPAVERTQDASSSVNPARAGMIPSLVRAEIVRQRKPRASGDDPVAGMRPDVMADVNPARAGMIPASDRRTGGRRP